MKTTLNIHPDNEKSFRIEREKTQLVNDLLRQHYKKNRPNEQLLRELSGMDSLIKPPKMPTITPTITPANFSDDAGLIKVAACPGHPLWQQDCGLSGCRFKK